MAVFSLGARLARWKGLYYYGARYYAAWIGRFISVDPLVEKFPQLTPYNYAGNKPVTHKDLEGLQGTGDNEGDVNEKQENSKKSNIQPKDEYEEAILNKKISFTSNYGWVDNTHAFTDTSRNEPFIGVEKLWEQLENEPSSEQIYLGYYSVNYKQDIVLGNLSIGIERQYLVKAGLNLEERKSVALAIFQDVSMAFEQMQGLHPTSGSSFEPADLPSNMISFYRTVEGMSRVEIEAVTKPVSPEESLEVYRAYPGTFTDSRYKNKSFQPKYFDSPYTSSSFGVPDILNTIQPLSIKAYKDLGKAKLIFLEQDLIRFRN